MDNLEQALLESENSLMLLSDEELITPINDMLIINPETRLIEIPDTELLLGVFGENLVEKKYFKCPRIVLNNIDLYECFIFINYVSANGRIGSIQSENVELDETEQYILFDWDLTSNVFDKNKDSTIYFSVSAKQYLEDSEPVFATRKAQGKMYETINGTEYITQEHADIILQILAGMKTKVDLPKDEDGNLLVPEEGQTLLFKEDGTTYYGTPSSGGGTSFSGSAKDVTYDDTETKLGAENVQDAIGKLSEDITIEVEYDFLLLHESDGVNSSHLDVGVDVEVGDVLKCVTPRVDGKNLDDRIDIYTSVDGVDKYQSLEFPIIKDVFGETPITEVELIVEITEEVTSIRVRENTTVYKREEITIGKKVSSIETELIKVQKEKADKKDIPTKTSQLKNDSNFITTENINVCVKLTFENGLYVADKTYEEIVEFYNNGYSPYVVLNNNVFRLYKVNESSFEFAYCQVGTVEVMIDKVIITNNNINIVQSSTEILKEISKQSHWRFEKVDSIPVNDASYNVIYLVQRFDEDNHVKGNIYDEYIFLKDGNRYELIGSTDIDLSNVYQKSETYSKEEVNALVKAVSDAVTALQSKVPSKTSQLTDDVGFAKQTVVDGLQEEIDDLKGGEIPDYWYGAFTDSAGKTYTNYLSEKIETIKALQRQYGKDCFSFLLITDVHYPSNLGKRSPTLADRIMDECNIKHALNAGDNNTRGCYLTLEEILSENKQIAKMFAPIKDSLLIIEGNHDGSYYWSDGVLGSGTAYVKQLTEQGMFEEYYRANGLNAEAHFDKNSNAFYVDDLSNKVRYIGLNSMNVPNSKDDVNADGTAKYSKFYEYQFLQAQYDFLCNEALVNGLTDDWKVVVFGHSGIYNAGDYAVMVDVLSAYKDKTNCVSEYVGTAEGGSVANYDNLLDEDGDGFLWGYMSSDGSETPFNEDVKWGFFSNYIPITTDKTNPDLLRVLDKNKKLQMVKVYDKDKNPVTALQNWITVSSTSDFVYDENGVMTWKAAYVNNYVATTTVNSLAYVRLYFRDEDENDFDLNDFVITVNEEIEEIESNGGYDTVSVNCDFSEAKGKFVAYFHGHDHKDADYTRDSIKDISTRCDGVEEHTEVLQNERVKGTITEQSFDVFTVTSNKIYATKIGAGADRVIEY